VCPISYEDPSGVWEKLQSDVIERLPLRSVTWKDPVSSSFVVIDKLPLRLLPATSSLFRDTNNAFRWFLAPYVHLYIVTSESLVDYKAHKPALKKWVDLYNSGSNRK